MSLPRFADTLADMYRAPIGLLFIGLLLGFSPATYAAESCPQTIAGSLQDLRCCLTMDAELDGCLSRALGQFSDKTTTKELLDQLETLRTKDKRFDLFTHEITHAIGRRAVETFSTFAGAFHSCDARFQGGCYHGVMEAVIATPSERAAGKGHMAFSEIKERIPDLCTEKIGGGLARGLRAQCQHGLGHAILYTLDYRLKEALSGCDLLADSSDRQNCLLGVFMENTTATERAKRDLKAGDPLYPCSALLDRYRSACFLDQTRVMFHMGLSPEQIAEECTKASGFERECFRSLGRDLLTSLLPPGIRAAARECEVIAGTFAPSCIDGAVATLVDISVAAADAYPYCRALSSDELRLPCLRSVHRYLAATYEKDTPSLLKECERSSGTLRTLCAASLQQRPAPRAWWDVLGFLMIFIR